ncbi:hypothetical protein FQN57_004894 [Myotisia sp. PD_48]|nr:hypothetical protein FQN57_004894 [Myotisia sp. PD_48]
MLSSQAHLRRIPHLLRPLRPPRPLTDHGRTLSPRLFTSNSQLLLLTSPINRPQLPFLHTPSAANSGHPIFSNRILNAVSLGGHHVPRLISTERRKKITNGIKIALTAYAVIILFYVAQLGLYQEEIEQVFPTPPDWTWKSRWFLRTARALQTPERQGKSNTNWPLVGSYYRELLERLENTEVDGKGLVEQSAAGDEEEGAILIDGVGKAGYDIEGMSESWKKGYFEALMGAGETAEKLDGWMDDKKKGIASPPEYVVGPSNPNPKPVPKGMIVPDEENSVPAYESPEVYYMKILTTKGFQTNQKLDAALAYADWLDFKGLNETAGEVYNWAMDITIAGLPGVVNLDVDAEKIVDRKTGVLKKGGYGSLTENLLRTSTALGIHQVRIGNLTSALSVFLSVLQARRNISTSTDIPSIKPPSSFRPHSKEENVLQSISYLFSPPPYPLPTRTGNEHPLHSESSGCEEAGLMIYIGEIIFASSSQEKGLAWTRDAVDHAEISLLQLDPDQESGQPHSHAMEYSTAEEKCRDCLRTGLDNWKKMVRKLVVRAENEELQSMDRMDEAWFGRGRKKVQEKRMQRRRWEAEELILNERAKRVRNLIGDSDVPTLTAAGDSIFFFA